ncbi:Ig-like domain-containing protein [Corynebacterium pseudotuberculosis]|uniref:Ig-like domain-containing protein n=1 Tax=Corynebacterium pseudotuberculosis TaxID=1719 RepID=UPI000BC0DFF3|nr:Ig-like domain-containing protein [Corynebacterium pseudotuberculosis]ATB62732.1 Hypothetical protein BFF96_1860 [Corynebacterium pseudotuberculosis]
MEFNWSVDPSAKTGDRFSVKLPPQLITVETGELKLSNDKGETVATATISSGQKEVVFILTKFVSENFQVKGSAHFTVE